MSYNEISAKIYKIKLDKKHAQCWNKYNYLFIYLDKNH